MDWIILGIPLGIVMLYFGSDWLVKGSKDLALKLGLAPFVVGLTIIAFGSSAPEIITAAVSSANPGIVLGNAIGSNIANIGLAIGIAAVICPMAAVYKSMKLEICTMLGTAVLVLLMALTGTIGFIFGIILLACIAVFLVTVYLAKKEDPEAQAAYTEDASDTKSASYPVIAVLIILGLVCLYYGATFFVDGAVSLAHMIGVSDLLVGLIVVALGTSLPEICICALAARRGENELAVANIVGSNIFNATAVLGTGAVLADIPVSESVLQFHLPVMLILSALLFFFVYRYGRIDRKSGILVIAIYAAYLAILVAFPSMAM